VAQVGEARDVIDLTDTALVTDDELVRRARAGDRRAFGTLYLRHRDAAWRVACTAAATPTDAEDAVAEGFAKVFAALPRMMGRELAFRPYLIACVRNAAIDRHRRDRHIDLTATLPEQPAGPAGRPEHAALLDLERNLVGEALQSLPERWRTVLWLTEVEGMTPAEVSTILGIKPNAVAALAYRAREGLREAYLQAHLRAEAPAECRFTVDRLGPYVRGELAERDRVRVHAHLDDCFECRRRRDELADVNATLRAALVPVPLLLGSMSQRKWLSMAHLGQGARRVKPPAKAAKNGTIVNSPVVQQTIAGMTAVVLALATGVAIHGFAPHRAPTFAAPAPVVRPPSTEVLGATTFRDDLHRGELAPVAAVADTGTHRFRGAPVATPPAAPPGTDATPSKPPAVTPPPLVEAGVSLGTPAAARANLSKELSPSAQLAVAGQNVGGQPAPQSTPACADGTAITAVQSLVPPCPDARSVQ
jgi:RNA polymerase sigma factor (sigma-70 family)